MIPYEVYCRVRQLHREGVLSYTQIAQELNLHPDTVSKYAAMESFTQRRYAKRASKLDAHKATVVRWLERYPYSATQVYQRLQREEGYTGGASIVKEYVRAVRPPRRPAYLTLAFAPGRLGLCGNHLPGIHATEGVLFRHGPLPQPADLRGVHLWGAHGTLPRLPSQRLGLFLRHARGHHDR